MVSVTTARAVEKDVPVLLRAVGEVQAHATVAIKSVVGGQLQRVHFREGQDVAKGDILFTIDTGPFEAALNQAKANLIRDTVQFENAQKEAARYEQLLKNEYISVSQYEQMRTNAGALKALVDADKAAIENAALQLGYCSIRAPISGRLGSILLHEGNIIKATDDNKALVIINQMQPIYVDFAVAATYLNQINTLKQGRKLIVEVTIPQGPEGSSNMATANIVTAENAPIKGVLTFVDNTVDKTTGTIHLKGEFANSDRRLWPGQFVNVLLYLTTRPRSIVVPSEAVLTGQKGQYVFVVSDNQTVTNTPVATSITTEGHTVVDSGLHVGDNVVTDGQLRLVTGSKVAVKDPSRDVPPGGKN
ncbi:RND family efflux transporter MFP subunit [Candidatus Magnetobacterium bavaricum]|uniref:RND family efflux transporter MFP subunit n=1 Tax=Candidatus Magnetobacterium bavaricum TaxID=29290 RepID=A0A0F3GIL2_9BACT|nr:RND family efflux transporter MFP subunit [Candidatus Magnetobacterium bavaricum]